MLPNNLTSIAPKVSLSFHNSMCLSAFQQIKTPVFQKPFQDIVKSQQCKQPSLHIPGGVPSCQSEGLCLTKGCSQLELNSNTPPRVSPFKSTGSLSRIKELLDSSEQIVSSSATKQKSSLKQEWVKLAQGQAKLQVQKMQLMRHKQKLEELIEKFESQQEKQALRTHRQSASLQQMSVQLKMYKMMVNIMKARSSPVKRCILKQGFDVVRELSQNGRELYVLCMRSRQKQLSYLKESFQKIKLQGSAKLRTNINNISKSSKKTIVLKSTRGSVRPSVTDLLKTDDVSGILRLLRSTEKDQHASKADGFGQQRLRSMNQSRQLTKTAASEKKRIVLTGRQKQQQYNTHVNSQRLHRHLDELSAFRTTNKQNTFAASRLNFQ